MFFPISGADISPIYLGRRWVLDRHYGRIFWSGRELHCRPRPAPGWFGLEFRSRHRSGAHRWQIGRSGETAHRAFGNVDLTLGLIMAIGTIGGAEVGAQLIQMFKRAGNVNLVVSVVSIVVYLSISAFMMWESRKTLIIAKKTIAARKSQRREVKRGPFCIRARHACDSASENLADGLAAGFGDKGNFSLDDSFGRVHGWIF